MNKQLNSLREQLDNCLGAERWRLRRELEKCQARIRRQNDAGENQRHLDQLAERIRLSCERRELRVNAMPDPEFPQELPVSARCAEIIEAIQQHQVVIICGETGSGKSTQLPKICLAAGRGVDGMIGHTQPRRIAARTLANRIASELKTQTGEVVGYKVRFSDHVSDRTLIKLMTDGILLAETQGDRWLNAYDTLIIDEAHERSLNIDFLLGYLKTILKKRPDLKVIVTSATIDPERFSRHFDGAPIIEVSGRTYPVDLRYRPLGSLSDDDPDRDLQQGILDAVDEVSRLDRGDILIFLPGEREIRETAESLRKHHPPDTDILPLYARLGSAEQNRIFQPHKRRHIVLTTNVAETSLTVPGIRFVIDPGQARISRYSPRSKVQRLPIEAISQASADQRKGRCGRVSAGVCIRLYEEQEFLQRPAFTDPEILRTSLASVILKLQSLHFGDIEDFPFIEPPDSRYITDGYKLLEELGAVNSNRELTDIGWQLAKLPIDPRLARMVLGGVEFNCLTEVLIIASALSVQDIRDRPHDAQAKADEKHQQFADDDSDFSWFLNVWRFYREQQKHLSANKLRKLCKTNFLSFMRIREWADIHSQLRGLVHDMGFSTNESEAEYQSIHRALLTGLLGNIAFKAEKNEYTGARGIKCHIFPGSNLFRKGPRWMMCGELVETTRMYARRVAKIEPEWVVRAAPQLIRHSYFDAHWEKKAGRVVAYEKLSLYGLVLIPKQSVHYGQIDPAGARKIFIQEALVRGELNSRPEFLLHNQRLIREVEDLEHRSRRLDILADEQALYSFYEERLPRDIHNARAFNRWLKRSQAEQPELLYLQKDFLIQRDTGNISELSFPKQIQVNGLQLELTYRFEPGHDEDGVTLLVPLVILKQLAAERFEWLIPGLLKDKVTEMIRALPKPIRKHFVPAPDVAERFWRQCRPAEGSLHTALAAFLNQQKDLQIRATDWSAESLPDFLRMNFAVLNEHGHVLEQGRDLEALQRRLASQVVQEFSQAPRWAIEQSGLTDWSFPDLPDTVSVEQQGLQITGYPALVDETDSVAIRVLDTADEAYTTSHYGLRRLFRLSLATQYRYLARNLPGFDRMQLLYARFGKPDDLRDEVLNAVTERVFLHQNETVHTQAEFRQRQEAGRAELVNEANRLCQLLLEVLTLHHAIRRDLKEGQGLQRLEASRDISEQLDGLVYPGFLSSTDSHWLLQLPRYLKAISYRLERLDREPHKDRQQFTILMPFVQQFRQRVQSLGEQDWYSAELDQYHWMLEEFRVSLFAQQLGTSITVSAERLKKYWREVVNGE